MKCTLHNLVFTNKQCVFTLNPECVVSSRCALPRPQAFRMRLTHIFDMVTLIFVTNSGSHFPQDAPPPLFLFWWRNSCGCGLHNVVIMVVTQAEFGNFFIFPWVSCQMSTLAGCAAGMPWTFPPPPRVTDPDIHLGTCVTHVSWCMSGSLTSGFLWSRWRGKCTRHSRRMGNPQFHVFVRQEAQCAKLNLLWLLILCTNPDNHSHGNHITKLYWLHPFRKCRISTTKSCGHVFSVISTLVPSCRFRHMLHTEVCI